jgi:hypothetical protein
VDAVYFGDAIYLGIVLLFFGLCVGLVRLLERL